MEHRPLSVSHLLKLLTITLLFSAMLGVLSEQAAAGCGSCSDGKKWCYTCCTGGSKGAGTHCGCPSWSGCGSTCWQESCGSSGGGGAPGPYCGGGTWNNGGTCATRSTDCVCPAPTYELCCDFQKAGGSWYPSPPFIDSVTPYECVLDDPTYGLCRDGVGTYTMRGRYYQGNCTGVVGTLMNSSTSPYDCRLPLAGASMDGEVAGYVQPCDASTSCVAEDKCFTTS